MAQQSPQFRSPQFELVPENDPDAAPPHGAGLLLLALKTLSQRTLLAIDNLFTLITVGLVFWLWYSIPDPNTNQITALGIFAAFVLAANFIVRRK